MSTVIRQLNLINTLKKKLVRQKICLPKSTSTYFIRIAFPEDYEKILKLMVNTYFNREPSLVNIGLANHPSPILVGLVYKTITQGLTIYAEENHTGCVVGAAINSNAIPCDADKLDQIANHCETGLPRDLIKFYAHCSRAGNIFKTYDLSRLFECSFLTVHPNHYGNGLATRLVLDSWVLARDLGYETFRIECSSRYSAKIAEKYGWKCIETIPYCNYCVDDKVVFNYVEEPHREMKIYISDLNYFCTYYPKEK